MAKLLDPAKALAARGYAGPDTAIDIIVNGSKTQTGFSLAIIGGKAVVAKAQGDESVTVRENDLTALFMGYRSASFLARAGRLDGGAEAITRCDRIFAGPAPWSAEHF